LLPVLRHLPELEERLDAKCLLQKFNIEESVSYIQHRLTVAGAMRQVFDDSALESMHHLSQGTPRRINRLGDLALLLGYAEELSLISARHIEALAEEMLLPFQD
jgi:general secretion pathway protein A